MMKKSIALILLLFVLTSYGQERISPLRYNAALQNKIEKKTHRSIEIDSSFVYLIDTLNVPFFDDFAINKFEQYNAGFGDAGVVEELFYQLMDETNTTPVDPGLIFCDSLYAHTRTVTITDGIPVTTGANDFVGTDLWVNDLSTYPVNGEVVNNLYQECFVLIDTILEGVLDLDQDTLWYTGNPGPAIRQDSARVFTKTINDPSRVWVDNHAYHNYTFAYNPWSLGVATFDGVDQFGMPYEFGDDDAYGIADYLTSKPLNLQGKSDVWLTFIYQAKGLGNMPENQDSLILEYWNVDDEIWQRAWYQVADSVVADNWDTAHVFVNTPLLRNGFQFRFKNYASLSGALDHWHIDYVLIEDDASPAIDNFSDLAISYPINTLLKDYTRVPWDHYKVTSGNEKMLDRSEISVYNSDLTATIFAAGGFEIRYGGILQGGSPFNIPSTGTVEPNYVTGLNNCFFDVADNYYYDQSVGGVQAKFDVKVNIASAVSGANQYTENDTCFFTQRFDNYYAYDDGSAEAAYGVDGENSLMAYKFDAYQAGELTGILIHFVPSVIDHSSELFLLTVWGDNDGVPGDIIYQDSYAQAHSPEYNGSLTGFRYYKFAEDAFIPVDEVFYVGWENIENVYLNVGADFNTANGDKVLRNTAGTWLTSAYDISLLIRPVFSTGLDYTLGIEREEPSPLELKMFPNPTNGVFKIDGLPTGSFVSIYDLTGRMVFMVHDESEFDISYLNKGVYIVDVKDTSGNTIHTGKIIKD
jgi:hypothetical protein